MPIHEPLSKKRKATVLVLATMGRQRITVATANLVASRSEPPPSTGKGKLPSIATRTLAVVASLWSSSSSSSVHHHHHNLHQQQQQQHRNWNSLPLLNPLPCVYAFQPETRVGIPRRGWQQQQQQQHWQPNNNNTYRWYHNSPRPFLQTTKASKDDESIAQSSPSPSPLASTPTAVSVSVVSSDAVESTRHLPRLFVGSHDDDSSASANAETMMVPLLLRKKSLIPLNADQEHYLLDVMRITNPKRWGRGKTTSGDKTEDYTGCVRIFNGIDGEWLARVAEDPGGDPGGSNPKKQRRKRGGNKTQTASSSGTVLECLELLRSQDPRSDNTPGSSSSSSRSANNLRLYLGYIRDKQRRRWVFEKATELGIDSVTILETDFSNNNNGNNSGDSNRDNSYKKKDVRWEDDREKHKLHVIEAAEQCERLTVPSVGAELWSVEAVANEVVAKGGGGDKTENETENKIENKIVQNDENEIENETEQHLWLVCRERSESSPPILSVLEDSNSKNQQPTTIHLLVGPEGGWSPRELEVFSSLQQVRFVSLGSSVLRAETAAITAVASVTMHRETLGGR